jgi:hypothetical protein
MTARIMLPVEMQAAVWAEEVLAGEVGQEGEGEAGELAESTISGVVCLVCCTV